MARPTVDVRHVIDGDTLIVDSPREERVRLLGVDAPEVGRDGRIDECGAAEATARVRELVEAGGNKVVLVDDERAGDRDRFGRLLRHVEVHDLDVGAQLVVEGWAIAWAPRSASRPGRLDAYERAQAAAREERRGGWGVCQW